MQRENADSIDNWRFEKSDWEELEILKSILSPFKDATLKLESSSSPTAQVAGRVMLWLMYKSPALADKIGMVGLYNIFCMVVCFFFHFYILIITYTFFFLQARRPFRNALVQTIREKLATLIDDTALVTEWAVAHILDPR